MFNLTVLATGIVAGGSIVAITAFRLLANPTLQFNTSSSAADTAIKTIQDKGVVITATAIVEPVINTEERAKVLGLDLQMGQLLYQGYAVVDVGVDLAQAQVQGETVILPAPQPHRIAIDPNRSKTYSYAGHAFDNSLSARLQTEAQQQVVEVTGQRACEGELLDRAKANAINVIQPLVSGHKIEFRSEPCQYSGR